jgi:uncharacterized membrane protein YtjA (UPF0391 family)
VDGVSFVPHFRWHNYLSGSSEKNNLYKLKTSTMLRWSLIFLVVALIAALFGFTGIAAGAASIAKILFFVFLVLFVVALIAGSSLVKRK